VWPSPTNVIRTQAGPLVLRPRRLPPNQSPASIAMAQIYRFRFSKPGGLEPGGPEALESTSSYRAYFRAQGTRLGEVGTGWISLPPVIAIPASGPGWDRRRALERRLAADIGEGLGPKTLLAAEALGARAGGRKTTPLRWSTGAWSRPKLGKGIRAALAGQVVW